MQLRGTRFESNLLRDDHFRLGLTGAYLSDYGGVEDDRVAKLSAPEEALMGGLAIGYDFAERRGADLLLGIDLTYDVLNGNGAQVSPSVCVRQPVFGRMSIGGRVGASWVSQDFMSNRFGVSAGDAVRSGLSEFAANEGLKDVSIDLSLSFAVSDRWVMTGFAGYRRLLGDAAESPIVDQRGAADLLRIGAVLGYRF